MAARGAPPAPRKTPRRFIGPSGRMGVWGRLERDMAFQHALAALLFVSMRRTPNDGPVDVIGP